MTPFKKNPCYKTAWVVGKNLNIFGVGITICRLLPYLKPYIKGQPNKRSQTLEKKTNWGLVGMGVAWATTLGTLVWNVAVKDTNYATRLDRIEDDIQDLDTRLDTAEAFRMEIRSDLAEIKTDLIWIRRQLDHD